MFGQEQQYAGHEWMHPCGWDPRLQQGLKVVVAKDTHMMIGLIELPYLHKAIMYNSKQCKQC